MPQHPSAFFDELKLDPTRTGNKKFWYTPLDKDGRGYRVLDLYPVSQSAPDVLQCSIRHVSLTDNPKSKYEAISYCWGDPTPCVPISIDGSILLLPKSGEAALRRMALPDGTRTLWIDSACINQDDLKERAQQVTLMGALFRGASTVIVYLGEEDRTTHRAFADVRLLQQEIDEDIGPEADVTDLGFGGQHATYRQPIRTQLDVDSWNEFFDRPWFRRAWIVQEVVVASKTLCVCGTHVEDMDIFLRVSYWLLYWHMIYRTQGFESPCRFASDIWYVRQLYVQLKGFDLVKALLTGWDREAADGRDKLFSMLGLLHELYPKELLIPDYEKATSYVFRDAVRATFAHPDDPLDALRYIRHDNEAHLSLPNFPSWVPRFDQPRRSMTAFPIPSDVDYKRLGNVRSATAMATSFKDPNTLTLHGIMLSKLALTLPVLDERLNSIHTRLNLEAIRTVAAKHAIPPDTLARTLMTDCNIKHLHTTFEDRNQSQDFYDYTDTSKEVLSIRNINASTTPSAAAAANFGHCLRRAGHDQLFAITESGQVGLVPKICKVEDIVAMIHGSLFPLVLRRRGEEYALVGECYIDGYMCGQERREEIHQELMTKPNGIFNVR